jgi:sensor histidine kinase YesM
MVPAPIDFSVDYNTANTKGEILEYLHTLRVALPLAAVFGLGALVHSMLRERVRVAEEKLHEKEAAEERAQKLAAEARLSSLESRIHPHFLFNALNSISSLIVLCDACGQEYSCNPKELVRIEFTLPDGFTPQRT